MTKPTSYFQRLTMFGDVENIRELNRKDDRFKLQFVLSYKKKYFDKITDKSIEATTKWNCEVRSKYAEVLSKKIKEGMFVVVEGEIKADDTIKEGVKIIVTYVTPVFFEEELNG